MSDVICDKALSDERVAAVEELNRAYANHRQYRTPQTAEAIVCVQRKLTSIKARMQAEWSARNAGHSPAGDSFRLKRAIVGDLLKWREDIASTLKNPKTPPAEVLFSRKVDARLAHILRIETTAGVSP